MTSRARQVVLIALSLGVLASPIPMTTSRAAGDTPPGEVLVVDANLAEKDPQDATHDRDMRNFVNRMLKLVPKTPDVILVQEVRHTSVKKVASLLTKKTGDRFSAAVDAGRQPFQWQSDHKVIMKETAIIINRETMREAGRSGFMKTSYPRRIASDGVVRVKKHAYAMIEEKHVTGLKLPMVSVHFSPNIKRSSVNSFTKKWSRQVADSLAKKYSSTKLNRFNVIAGDFNCPNCRGGPCEKVGPTPFYRLITRSPYNYKDSVYEVRHENAVDFIFTHAKVADARSDENYNRLTKDRSVWYSDHKFRWALLQGS